MIEQLLAQNEVWFGVRPRSRSVQEAPACRFDIAAIDRALPQRGFSSGTLHEWCFESSFSSQAKFQWFAPLRILSFLAAKTFREHSPQSVLWVGRRCWPMPTFLRQFSPELLKHSVFLNPPKADLRLQSILQGLRSPAVSIVIADTSKFRSLQLRQIQLAARRGDSLGLLVRPPWEIALPSPAVTKWTVSNSAQDRIAENIPEQIWKLKLLHARGLPDRQEWLLTENEENSLHLLPKVVERSQQTQAKAYA